VTIATTPLPGTYAADPVHSSFDFSLFYMGVGLFRGSLRDVSVTLAGGRLDGCAQVASILTNSPEPMRSAVLGPDFFDVERFPELRFSSTALDLREDGTAAVTGELSMKGVTAPVEATGTWSAARPDAFGLVRGHLHLEGAVDRSKYGMGFNLPLPSGGMALSNDVTLTVELSLLEEM
jgi:polyisoprenoid-binding protein YceI